jgi:CubicO group peptidase (beta-lactamase class C family)
MRLCRAAILILSLSLPSFAWAQGEENLPPFAAPTSKVQVDAIPLVRSPIEQAGDFVSGLLRGLRTDERVQDISVVVVQNQHRPLRASSGTVDAGAQFPAGGIEHALYAVAVMQLVENGQIRPDQDIGTLLAGAPSGVLLGALMAGQGGDTATIVRVIEKTTGKPAADVVTARIFGPLGMTASTINNGLFRTSMGDMERFAAALVNGGSGENGTILRTSSVETLENTTATRPGWSFALPEMHRNGWRALQLDGAMQGFSSRLVISPGAKLAYALVVRGRPGVRLWRTLDDAIFDELLPPQPGTNSLSGTAPSESAARSLTGTYEPDRDMRSLVFLKFPEHDLRVRAGSDGSLILSGAENATLFPASAGDWSSRDGNLTATYRGDELFLSYGVAYRPVAFYKRPVLYALFALIAAIIMIGAMLFGSMPDPRTWFGRRRREHRSIDTSPTHQEHSA